MKCLELFEGYIDPDEDEMLKQIGDHSRKPKLTLKQLNKLKKIRATNELEDTKKKNIVSVMYNAGGSEEGGF